MAFLDRIDAGRRLARRLERFRDEDVVVLGLPRGGVPVAFEVARALGAPLDVIVVRKLGVPFQPELAMGAIGEGQVQLLDPDVVRVTGVTDGEIAAVERRERAELARRTKRFRADRPGIALAGRTAIVVDDGLATGSTARAACQVARAQGAVRVVLAVPVGPPRTVDELREEVDEVVCLEQPGWLHAIGQAYDDFAQTSDDQVVALLDRAACMAPAPSSAAPRPAGADGPDRVVRDEEVEVSTGGVLLAGRLTVPERARGAAVFVHGSGSSRHSPRNRFVATVLNQAGLATLLFDLLTSDEETMRANVFDIELLAQRLLGVTAWTHDQPETRDLALGYFGASTGAAAALWAAAEPDADVAAVVSRGGRPDLAAPRLAEVRAPTLLIVGEQDPIVLDLNRQARARLRCENRLAVVPGATHLFQEPGTLRVAAELARDWFTRQLGRARHHAA
jgi:putative phosphoribosyl transferase